MLKRGMGLVFFTTLQAVEGGVFVFDFLRDGACLIWRENSFRKWAFISYGNSVGGIQRYLDRVARAIRYREQYRNITLPMKANYRKLVGKKNEKRS